MLLCIFKYLTFFCDSFLWKLPLEVLHVNVLSVKTGVERKVQVLCMQPQNLRRTQEHICVYMLMSQVYDYIVTRLLCIHLGFYK